MPDHKSTVTEVYKSSTLNTGHLNIKSQNLKQIGEKLYWIMKRDVKALQRSSDYILCP
ncbi:MAG: hypothetical protein PVH12_03125 [Candidatus Bathyarchaeota archaeon]